MSRLTARLGLTSLLVSAVLVALAPLVMPSDYSWVSHSISESGAQGVGSAWVTRMGFLLLGLGVILVSLASIDRWRWPGAVLNGAFGLLMMCAAVFSTHSWRTDQPFDEFESNVHSLVATVMGIAYGVGVLAALIGDRRMPRGQQVFSIIASLSSIVLPLGMWSMPEVAGVLQRTMFAIAYVWFAVEAVRSVRATDTRVTTAVPSGTTAVPGRR